MTFNVLSTNTLLLQESSQRLVLSNVSQMISRIISRTACSVISNIPILHVSAGRFVASSSTGSLRRGSYTIDISAEPDTADKRIA